MTQRYFFFQEKSKIGENEGKVGYISQSC